LDGKTPTVERKKFAEEIFLDNYKLSAPDIFCFDSNLKNIFHLPSPIAGLMSSEPRQATQSFEP
jgi:hypothetical protein